MKLGRFNEESRAKQEEALAKKEEEEKAAAEAIAVGNRCKVQVPGQPTKIGTVMFVGKLTSFSYHISQIKGGVSDFWKPMLIFEITKTTRPYPKRVSPLFW